MRVRVFTTLAVAALLLATPLSAAASAYSVLTYSGSWFPPGYPHAALCGQSAIIDTARNYNQAVAKTYTGIGYCDGSNITVAAGYLGTSVAGYRDGTFCGYSSIYYSTTATSAWQLWITMCSDPAGLQAFHSVGYAWGYTGSGYQNGGGVTSPNQNY